MSTMRVYSKSQISYQSTKPVLYQNTDTFKLPVLKAYSFMKGVRIRSDTGDHCADSYPHLHGLRLFKDENHKSLQTLLLPKKAYAAVHPV